MDKTCATCRYWCSDPSVWVCCCAKSEHLADFVMPEDSCDKWEGEEMENFENWTEIPRGIYRYVIAANACYEIHILYHADTTPILTAKANLYLVGHWLQRERGQSFFERELLLKEQPVQECIKAAMKDNKENNT